MLGPQQVWVVEISVEIHKKPHLPAAQRQER